MYCLLVNYNRTSSTDGSFTMANSNSFLCPYKILSIAEENKYLGISFIMKLYAACTHKNCLMEAILMSTFNIQLLCRKSKIISPKLSLFDSWSDRYLIPHDQPSVARTTHISNKCLLSQRCSSHWRSTVVSWKFCKWLNFTIFTEKKVK